jgi:flagellar hook protein FlgE
MYSGVSGLRAESEAISVVGDNIANVNTIGFKGQRAVFEDVLGHSILAGSSQAGSGVRMGDVQQLFTQGSLSNTGVSTDIALNGEGFLVVKGTVDGIQGNFYTRAGQLNIDKDGFLVNPQGMQIQGYLANPDGTIQAAVDSLKVSTAALAPRATGEIGVNANLDATAATPALPWDPADPATTSNYSTSISVYDSLGTAHSLDVYFRKSGPNAYEYHVMADGADINGGTPGVLQEIGAGGTLAFTATGALNDATTPQLSIDFAGGAAGAQLIDLDFGADIAGGGTGLDGTTQFASPSAVSSQSQDGYATGEFSGISIDAAGLVQGLYTNGQKLSLGQLAVAKFRSNDGLARAGQNLWAETGESGAAALAAAGSGGRGAITGGALESSNVDLAEEFVGLIQHQRSFSANSRTITTADEMLQELINIKR